MIFGSTTVNKDFDKSLTYKHSSENFSVSQSIPQSESEKIRDAMKNVHPPQHLSKVARNGEQMVVVRYGSADYSKSNKNKNIYYQQHQINLLKRLREHKDQVE